MIDHADVREQLELAAVEPGGLDRLAAGDTVPGRGHRRAPRRLSDLCRGGTPARGARAGRPRGRRDGSPGRPARADARPRPRGRPLPRRHGGPGRRGRRAAGSPSPTRRRRGGPVPVARSTGGRRAGRPPSPRPSRSSSSPAVPCSPSASPRTSGTRPRRSPSSMRRPSTSRPRPTPPGSTSPPRPERPARRPGRSCSRRPRPRSSSAPRSSPGPATRPGVRLLDQPAGRHPDADRQDGVRGRARLLDGLVGGAPRRPARGRRSGSPSSMRPASRSGPATSSSARSRRADRASIVDLGRVPIGSSAPEPSDQPVCSARNVARSGHSAPQARHSMPGRDFGADVGLDPEGLVGDLVRGQLHLRGVDQGEAMLAAARAGIDRSLGAGHLDGLRVMGTRP